MPLVGGVMAYQTEALLPLQDGSDGEVVAVVVSSCVENEAVVTWTASKMSSFSGAAQAAVGARYAPERARAPAASRRFIDWSLTRSYVGSRIDHHRGTRRTHVPIPRVPHVFGKASLLKVSLAPPIEQSLILINHLVYSITLCSPLRRSGLPH